MILCASHERDENRHLVHRLRREQRSIREQLGVLEQQLASAPSSTVSTFSAIQAHLQRLEQISLLANSELPSSAPLRSERQAPMTPASLPVSSARVAALRDACIAELADRRSTA